MRFSEGFFPTLKEAPSEAQMPSHQYMVRAGLVRQLAAGAYSYLPLGWRAARKVMAIIREEMDAIGGAEFHLPALNPLELWQQTGRDQAMGDVMFHIKNREGLVLAPTHEEVIAFHARQHIKSYKDMPQIWYQIQTKFRNEARPKSGVLRGRQFTMKDSYSLDASPEGLDASYDKHAEAYRKIFTRCGLKFFVVGASSGAMGGSRSQEFMVESPWGEDTCAVCEDVEGNYLYAANLEAAASLTLPVDRISDDFPIEEFATPNAKTINDLVEQFGFPEERCAKSVVYIADSRPVLALMAGNDELNEAKLQSALGAAALRPATDEELRAFFGASGGSLGPVGLDGAVKIIADKRLENANALVSGANKDGYHFKHIDLRRDARVEAYRDLRTAKEGEFEPGGKSVLRMINAIEIGHIFKLGTKYSEALGATFLNAEGKEQPIIMGSYGIGVERILACFIEQNHDEAGIKWHPAIAPYQAHLIGLGLKKSDAAREAAAALYAELRAAGVEVLYDDRDATPGVKFNDADLLGMPLQIIVGEKHLKNGNAEIKDRASGERSAIPLAHVVAEARKYVVQGGAL